MRFEAVPPDPSPSDEGAGLAARLDRLEHVLRDELVRQKRRADDVERQLRALGQLDERAEALVAEARAEATQVLEAARHELDQATAARQESEELLREAELEARTIRLARSGRAVTGGASLDEELLIALRDHLIDTGALQTQMMTETRHAVIKLIQASSQARGSTVLRPVPSTAPLRQARR